MVVIGLLGLPAIARGEGGVTVEELRSQAESAYDMTCYADTGGHACYAWPLTVTFTPASGEATFLRTQSDEDPYYGMGEIGRGFMNDFHDRGCQDAAGVAAFVDAVAALTSPGDVAPASLALCDLRGGLEGGCEFDCYWVAAALHDPPPAPTPPPTPTSRPTEAPTLRPQRTPPPILVPTPLPTAAPSRSPRPSPTQSPSPSVTPEQSVLVGNPTPTATVEPLPAPGSPAEPPPRPGLLAASVAAPWEVSVEPMAIGGSALVALLLLLFIGFTSELFNSTFESNYDEIAGWLGLQRGGRARFGRLWRTPLGVALFLAAGALVYLLLDPSLALDVPTVAVYLGMLLGLGVVLLAFEAPPLLLYRRRTGTSPGVRALPWTLPAAALCVLVSRVAGLEPGYLYGLLLGLVFQGELTASQEGRQTAAGAAWTLAVAVAAWLGLGFVRGSGLPPDQFGGLLLETALAVIAIGGLEAVAFGLLPLRFLSGAAVYGWSRLAWAVLFGISVFAFVHLLVGPNTGYLAELTPAALVAALGAFAAFGAFSVLFWGYFRFRPVRAEG